MKAVLQSISLFFLFILCIFLGFTFSVPLASAQGNATIQFSPSNGSFSKEFNVSLVVNGEGERFNAAQATVTISQNLSVQNLTLGNCNFSFLTTPSIANLSFAGVILGGSSTNCTAYTLTLAPVQKGNALITLSKGSVRRYGDAVNILSSMQNGNYTLTNTVKITPQPTIITPKTGLYTLVLMVSDIDSKSIQDTQINMHSVANKTPLRGRTDTQGKIQFTNIVPGVYDVQVQGYSGDTIVNVTGKNNVLVLGIKLRKSQANIFSNPFFIGGLIIVSIFIGGIIMWFLLRKKWIMRKN